MEHTDGFCTIPIICKKIILKIVSFLGAPMFSSDIKRSVFCVFRFVSIKFRGYRHAAISRFKRKNPPLSLFSLVVVSWGRPGVSLLAQSPHEKEEEKK